jgi:hypothetical protein
LWVPVVIKPQADVDAGALAVTAYGELMEYLDIVPRISQMPQGLLYQEPAVLGKVLGRNSLTRVGPLIHPLQVTYRQSFRI